MINFTKRFLLVPIFLGGVLLGAPGDVDTASSVADFLTAFHDRLTDISDYQTRVSQWSLLDDNRDAKVMNYYYLAPDHIRVDVIEGTRGKGTTGILRPDGRVAARPPLGPLSIRFIFDIDHSMVTTNRGRTFLEASLAGIYTAISDYSDMSRARIEYSEGSIALYLYESDSDIMLLHIIIFDSETLLPIESNTYERDVHVEHVEWSNYLLNQNLPKRVFEISMNQLRLRRAGLTQLALLPVADSERHAAGL